MNNGTVVGGPLSRQSQIRRTATMVMVLDGLRVIDGKVARISARHNGKKMTNVMMADGHAESLPTKSLPQLDEHLQRKGGQDPWQKGYFYKNPQWRFDHP